MGLRFELWDRWKGFNFQAQRGTSACTFNVPAYTGHFENTKRERFWGFTFSVMVVSAGGHFQCYFWSWSLSRLKANGYRCLMKPDESSKLIVRSCDVAQSPFLDVSAYVILLKKTLRL